MRTIGILFTALVLVFMTTVAPCLAVEKGTGYAKFYFNVYRAGSEFPDSWSRRALPHDGKVTFRTAILEGIYGVSEAQNLKVCAFWVHSVEEGEFEGTSVDLDRSGITDLWIYGNHYFSKYPRGRSLYLGLKVPLGYDEGKEPWLANGAWEAAARFNLKRASWDERWVLETESTVQVVLNDSERVKRGGWSLPYYGALEYRTRERLTLLAILSGAGSVYRYYHMGSRMYGPRAGAFYAALGGGMKYVLTKKAELELNFTPVVIGYNAKAGFSLGVGISYGLEDL